MEPSKISFEDKGSPRPYQVSDKEACLDIYDGNSPKFLIPDEREKFIAYLDSEPKNFSVVEDGAGKVVACGGYLLGDDGGSATLCWGMVHREFHGQNMVQLLLQSRLSALAQDPKVKVIRLDASQASVEFFVKMGFVTYRITQNHFGPNLHRYEMYMVMDEDKIKEILSKK